MPPTPVAAPASPVLVSAAGLCFDAGGKRLIDDLDIRIREGRCSVIMGANGAGKSLLLRLMHGLLTPSAGEIRWRGRPMDRAARRAQAMVFQRPVMLRRSVLANLRFALSVRGLRAGDRDSRIFEALRRARLEDMAHRPARVLSGGEQQRLAVVRALACDPELLFLDEPTASLDPSSAQAVEDLIAHARARGVTVVMITHDPAQARRLGEDLHFVHSGQVVESGPVQAVLDHPRSEAAQAWLDGRLFVAPGQSTPT
jgi:tungstate transport system ATP-binding protein